MPIDTSLIGPLFQTPNAPESTSFLHAFETAQHQNSPLYHAQVMEAQKRVQQMGFEMQSEQLVLEPNPFTLMMHPGSTRHGYGMCWVVRDYGGTKM